MEWWFWLVLWVVLGVFAVTVFIVIAISLFTKTKAILQETVPLMEMVTRLTDALASDGKDERTPAQIAKDAKEARERKLLYASRARRVHARRTANTDELRAR